jgi:hypothetical protein
MRFGPFVFWGPLVFGLIGLFGFFSWGCHEEPPIIIKFEPADAAGAHAPAASKAPTASPDAAAATTERKDASPPTATTTAPKKGAECQTATDCEVVPVECCDCANGGKQQAVSKRAAAQIRADRPNRCKGVMCTMMVSTDPTCGKRADCAAGKCVMVEKK